MDFITKILAQLFEKFKTGSPKLAAVIILLLGSVIFWAENGLGDLIGYDLSEITKWVAIVLGMLTGSHTTKLLEAEKKE
jgi:hypothetical protein